MAQKQQEQTLTIIKPRGVIGSFTFDAVFSENHTADTEITRNPIELGAKTTDHAYDEPIVYTLEAGVTDYPTEENPSFDQGSDGARSASAYQQLLRLKSSKELFTVQTGLITYTNMLIKTIDTRQDKDTSNVLYFTAILWQLKIVKVKNVPIPNEFLQAGITATRASATVPAGNQLPLELTPKEIAALQKVQPSALSAITGVGR